MANRECFAAAGREPERYAVHGADVFDAIRAGALRGRRYADEFFVEGVIDEDCYGCDMWAPIDLQAQVRATETRSIALFVMDFLDDEVLAGREEKVILVAPHRQGPAE